MSLSFMDQVLAGTAKPEDIDDFVGAWHDSTANNGELHDFLGMTVEEYHNWTMAPDTIGYIIEIQRKVRAARIAITHAVAKESNRIN